MNINAAGSPAIGVISYVLPSHAGWEDMYLPRTYRCARPQGDLES